MPEENHSVTRPNQPLRETQPAPKAVDTHLWPVIPLRPTNDCFQQLNQHATNGFACDQIPDPIVIQQTTCQSLLQLMPIADPAKANQLAETSKEVEVIATVDHYAHLETLQKAAASKATKLKVLVAVNSGANYFGCRPGTEALQLALACRQQANLNFAGLTSEIPAHRTVHDINSDDCAMGALTGTAAKLQTCDVNCPMLHLRTHAPISFSQIPTNWHASFPLQSKSKPEANPQATSKPFSQQLTATVIARPSLRRAVIDCGNQILFPTHQIILSTSETIPILHMDPARCVLDMTNVSSELKIGQQIQFTLANCSSQ